MVKQRATCLVAKGCVRMPARTSSVRREHDDFTNDLLRRAPDPGYSRSEAVATLAAACRTLSSRDSHVLYLRFVRGLTQQEIGDELGVTQMQVSRRPVTAPAWVSVSRGRC